AGAGLYLQSCSNQKVSKEKVKLIQGLGPKITADELKTVKGIDYKVFISHGELINSQGDRFGFNNDYIGYRSLGKNEAILWVNHEDVNPIFINGWERSKKNIDEEMRNVGGTLIHVKKENGNWTPLINSKYNRRLDANTKIPFSHKTKILNQDFALGTMANCAGGVTPWGSILTCEENYDSFFGERNEDGSLQKSRLDWEKFYKRPPEHYGYVVEINPKTGDAVKHVQMGRFAHECATYKKGKSGKACFYMGDDRADQCLYKFISDKDDQIENGKLYVASLENKKWISLSIEDQPILKKNFKNQTEVYMYTRKAAGLVGGSKLDRPEDIEVDPLTGDIFICLTNNKKKGNYFGQILKVSESNDNAESLNFTSEIYMPGGLDNGFASPDNLEFDKNGNLWMTTDISGSSIEKGPYKGFGNNGLFFIGRVGSYKGKIIKVASAPKDAEFTGPCFADDGETLFLSVQHPGELTKDLENPTSTWPTGKGPKPSVVTLGGPTMKHLLSMG
ncbi:DUF839 domain-containing protein, partial [Bacteriovoracaceae bacterium]|nr:DUF839 domain-containing protein [Bacteriovoracaceae bacterium]